MMKKNPDVEKTVRDIRRHTRGLFTPYGSVEMAGGGGRTLALGWRFELGQSLSLSLAGERRETALARPEHGLMLRSSLPW